MIQICYSLDEAIEISGTQKEIEFLRLDLLKFLMSDLKEFRVDVDKNINPKPWDSIAKSLIFIKSGNSTKVTITSVGILTIEGSKSNLENLTSFMWFEENARSGSHSHYEHYEGNEWIYSDSIPLIIQIK